MNEIDLAIHESRGNREPLDVNAVCGVRSARNSKFTFKWKNNTLHQQSNIQQQKDIHTNVRWTCLLYRTWYRVISAWEINYPFP